MNIKRNKSYKISALSSFRLSFNVLAPPTPYTWKIYGVWNEFSFHRYCAKEKYCARSFFPLVGYSIYIRYYIVNTCMKYSYYTFIMAVRKFFIRIISTGISNALKIWYDLDVGLVRVRRRDSYIEGKGRKQTKLNHRNILQTCFWHNFTFLFLRGWQLVYIVSLSYSLEGESKQEESICRRIYEIVFISALPSATDNIRFKV